MSTKRKDKKGRVLKDGEYQRRDGMYEFRYKDKYEHNKSLYSWRLSENDVTPSGKRKDLSLREKEARLQADMNKGIDNTQRTTLNDLFYMNMNLREFNNATEENYRYMWIKFIQDTLGRKEVVKLKKSDVLAFYAESKKKGLSNGTIHTFQKMIHSALGLAVEDHVINVNPSDGCCRDYPEGKSSKRAMTVDEMERFMKYLRTCRSRLRYELLFTIMLGTACRIGEIMGLTWKDVDMEKRTISINHSLLYRKKDGKIRFYAKEPKTENGVRIIPMTQEVYECFVELQETRDICPSTVEIDGYSDFVFTSMKGKPLYPANINKALYKIVDKYNAEMDDKLPKISNHIFRHTGCTRMAEAEVDIDSLQYIMGHEDYKMISRIYDNVTQERVRNQLKKLDSKRFRAG